MNIQEIRQKYPQYADISDEQLLRGFHEKFYADMPYEQFAAKIEGAQAATGKEGLAQVAAEQKAANPHKTDPNELGRNRDFGSDLRGALASGPINLYLGTKQLLSGGLDSEEQSILRMNREAADRLPPFAVASNVLTAVPAAMIPGVNTVAGGALVGGAQGALQPVADGESRLANTVMGGVVGAAVPTVFRAGRALKAGVVDPFTTAGRDRIAVGAINRATANPNGVMARLLAAKGSTPGFKPTAGQAANDAGLASMERAVRATQPAAFDAADKAQREALANALRGVAKDPISRQAAVDARDTAAESLYGKAFKSDAMRRDLAKQQTAAAAPFTGAGISAGSNDLATPGLRELAQRPMFRQAIDQAKALAANKGVQLDDPLQSLQGLHYIKLALDDMANPQASTAMGRNAAAAVNDMRSKLTEELATVSPTYGAARSTYADMSRPINQMDIGHAFSERLMPALYRDMDAPTQLNAAAYARALSDQGDDIARNVTGMKGMTLDKAMDPDQLFTLRGVADDLQMMKSAENVGRGPGSDTVQKAAMSHLAAEAGIPNWMASVARVPGGWVKRAGDVLYGNADDQIRARMAELLANPQEAGQLMQRSMMPPHPAMRALERTAITAGQTLPALTSQ